MFNSVFSSINIATNFILLILLVFYFFYLRIKEKAINKKENKIDSDYHKIIDDALARERKIIGDTTQEADKILASAQYVNESTKEAVNQALQKMIEGLEQRTIQTSHEFVSYYLGNLKELTHQSLGDFTNISKEMETDLRKQIEAFNKTLLPNLEKEISNYRETRMKLIDNSIKTIVQKVSREVLNKSIAVEDHEKLVLESLEKAKAEGIFD